MTSPASSSRNDELIAALKGPAYLCPPLFRNYSLAARLAPGMSVEPAIALQHNNPSVNDIFDAMVTASGVAPQMRAHILCAQPCQDMVIMVHMDPRFQPMACDFFQQEQFRDAARLFLVDVAEPLVDVKLIAEASVIRHSRYGELEEIDIHPKRVHIIGAYHGACVLAVQLNVLERLASKGQYFELFLHTDLIQSSAEQNFPMLAMNLRDGSKMKMSSRLRGTAVPWGTLDGTLSEGEGRYFESGQAQHVRFPVLADNAEIGAVEFITLSL